MAGPQGDCTDDEKRQGQEALEVMSHLYASLRGTTVLQQKFLPQRPAFYDGAIRLFDLPPELCRDDELRTYLSRFGTIDRCQFERHTLASTVSTHANVFVRNHSDATAAVFALKFTEKRAVTLLWNPTPYEGEGGGCNGCCST